MSCFSWHWWGTPGTGDGKRLMYGGARQGKVVFGGRTDASTGLACHDCHTASALLQTRKQALISMTDHGEPKACFACHNGQKAFNACQEYDRKYRSTP